MSVTLDFGWLILNIELLKSVRTLFRLLKENKKNLLASLHLFVQRVF